MAPTCDVDLYAYEQFGIKEFPEGARTHTFYQTDILQPWREWDRKDLPGDRKKISHLVVLFVISVDALGAKQRVILGMGDGAAEGSHLRRQGLIHVKHFKKFGIKSFKPPPNLTGFHGIAPGLAATSNGAAILSVWPWGWVSERPSIVLRVRGHGGRCHSFPPLLPGTGDYWSWLPTDQEVSNLPFGVHHERPPPGTKNRALQRCIVGQLCLDSSNHSYSFGMYLPGNNCNATHLLAGTRSRRFFYMKLRYQPLPFPSSFISCQAWLTGWGTSPKNKLNNSHSTSTPAHLCRET